jgi:hypothetical protein
MGCLRKDGHMSLFDEAGSGRHEGGNQAKFWPMTPQVHWLESRTCPDISEKEQGRYPMAWLKQ